MISPVFSYSTFAEDVLRLLDLLNVSRVSIVGWSDGAITGLQLAISKPERVDKLFAFGANISPEGLKPNGGKSHVFRLFADWCRKEYSLLSPHPERWQQLVDNLRPMWRKEPNFDWQMLRNITLPVAILYAEHDEIIKREHSERIADELSNSKFVLLPNVSHFALLQDSSRFNNEMIKFLM